MCLFTGDGRNSAINEVGGIIFVTATQIRTRVWRPKTLVLICSQYPRQSNNEFQRHCHECQKHSRDVVEIPYIGNRGKV